MSIENFIKTILMHNDSQVSFDKCTFWFDEERVSFDEG